MRASEAQEPRLQAGTLEQLPSLKLSPSDIQTIEIMLKGYLNGIRRMPRSSAKRNKSIQVIEGIRHRIKSALLALQSGQEVYLPLTYREFQAIDEALLGFMNMVRHTIVVSQDREETLADIEAMRQRIAHIPMQ